MQKRVSKRLLTTVLAVTTVGLLGTSQAAAAIPGGASRAAIPATVETLPSNGFDVESKAHLARAAYASIERAKGRRVTELAQRSAGLVPWRTNDFQQATHAAKLAGPDPKEEERKRRLADEIRRSEERQKEHTKSLGEPPPESAAGRAAQEANGRLKDEISKRREEWWEGGNERRTELADRYKARDKRDADEFKDMRDETRDDDEKKEQRDDLRRDACTKPFPTQIPDVDCNPVLM